MISKNKMSTRHRLKPLVDNSGFRKDYLASKLGISPSLFSHYLSGNRRMNKEIEANLKTLLGI